MHKIKKLVFPNSFGDNLPSAAEVEDLKKRYAFSHEYADFLNKQNGFQTRIFRGSDRKQDYLLNALIPNINVENTYKEEIHVIFGLEGNDLINVFKETGFIDYFFPIGIDPGGNIFVEFLIGTNKGAVGCINHEGFTCSANDFFKDLDQHYSSAEPDDLVRLKLAVPHIFNESGLLKSPLIDLPPAEKIDLLILYDWDFCSLTSKSFNGFINNIVVIEDPNEGGGYTLYTISET